MDAQGALDLLLGRLTTTLVNKAQQLGRIRHDVESIKLETEYMKNLILILIEANHQDPQIKTLMKEVVGLTRDCGDNVELYIKYVGGVSGGNGLVAYLRRTPRFLRTIPLRHQIATRIQELKVQAKDMGERWLRYGVHIPTAEPYSPIRDKPAPRPGSQEEEEDLQRQELFDSSVPDIILEEGTIKVLDWLLGKNHRKHRVIVVTKLDATVPGIAWSVYNHSSVACSFQFRAWVDFATLSGTEEVWESIRAQLPEPARQLFSLQALETPVELSSWLDNVTKEIEGKRFMIVLDNVECSGDNNDGTAVVQKLISIIERYDCFVDSALIVSSEMAYFIGVRKYSTEFFNHMCLELRAKALARCGVPGAPEILSSCGSDPFALQMFSRLIYASPNLSAKKMKGLLRDLQDQSDIREVMLRFCYKDLPINHKSCLLYLSIFPQHHKFRMTSLLRRWVAEGLVNARSTPMSELDDEAERIFNALVTRGFLLPQKTTAAGKVKCFTVPSTVHEFIVQELSYMDRPLSPGLAHRLSINNGVKLQNNGAELQEAPWSDRPFDTLTLLEQITGSLQWKLLKVLDLEGCRGLTKKHLENICQILLLKYLSLRDTDVKELPKQIEKLQCLETLDIRQTMVQVFSRKKFNLPMLKYLFAGHRNSSRNSFSKFKDPFTTVRLPSGIRRMKKLQVLSYVEVSNNLDDLNDIGQLLQLRKLGIIIHDNEDALRLLFRQIEKLHDCLRSLSIRINQLPGSRIPGAEPSTAMATPPRNLHLQSLNISGITSGLSNWIEMLDQLAEITLSETYLGEEAMCILGKLRILRCLQLLHDSYTASKVNFKEDEFQQLRSLVVKSQGITNICFDSGAVPKLRTLVVNGSDITNISFDTEAAPKLGMIVWSFTTMEALSGLDHLPMLKKLELNGDCNLEPVEAAIQAHPNNPVLQHNPHRQHHEGTTAAAASSSAAP